MILQFLISPERFHWVSWLILTAAAPADAWKADMDESPPPPQDYLTRISPDQVLCRIVGCQKAAAFLLYKYSGEPQRVVLAYCEDHVSLVAESLGIGIPL